MARQSRRGWLSTCGATLALLAIAGIIVLSVWVWAPMAKYPKFKDIDYILKTAYNGSDFFAHFRFSGESSGDNGFAQYIPREIASYQNLTTVSPSRAVMRVDNRATFAYHPRSWEAPGRKSVFIFSHDTFRNGLFVFDIEHTPVGCGVWAQLRLQDTERFPTHGEITVMDSVNNGTSGNTMGIFVHATHCSMEYPRVWRRGTGVVDGPTGTCSQRLHGLKGCRFIGQNDTFGPQFNANYGGVVAVEWREEGIRQWQWHREHIPKDILADEPRPNTWGSPIADFPSTHCTVTDPNLMNLRIVVNINLCGLRPEHDWKNSKCYSPPLQDVNNNDEDCRSFIAANPQALDDAYWEFRSIKIYEQPRGGRTEE